MRTRNSNSRFFISILITIIFLLICFNFIYSHPPFQISGGIIVLLAYLIILVLSEEFDRLSVFKILSLSRGIKEVKNQNHNLTKENSELRSQIISISTLSQKQINSTILVSDELAKTYNVLPANKPEKEEAEETEQPESIDNIDSSNDGVKEQKSKYSISRKIEEFALEKYLKKEGFGNSFVLKDAKFNRSFEKIDPVSEFSPIFDGYVKFHETEIFIEIKIKNRNVLIFRERIYLMLSKINYYRKVKRIDAYLILILVNKPDESYKNNLSEKLLIEFEPAISNGLLRIHEIELSDEELCLVNNLIQ